MFVHCVSFPRRSSQQLDPNKPLSAKCQYLCFGFDNIITVLPAERQENVATLVLLAKVLAQFGSSLNK